MFEAIAGVIQGGIGVYNDASGATSKNNAEQLALLNAKNEQIKLQNQEAEKQRKEKAKKKRMYVIGGIILLVVLVLFFKNKKTNV